MHSRIFQVSEKPIEKCDYIEESYYWDHWFVNEFADYVDGNTDRADDIQWLRECARGYTVGCDENGDYVIVTSKTEYFSRAFERFKEVINKLKDCTLEDFATEIYDMWSLKNAYEEKFGFYVNMDGDLLSFDSFVRHCTTDIKYYIGSTIDYHA